MTPIEAAFVCAILAMPQTWNEHHPMPAFLFSTVETNKHHAYGEYIPSKKVIFVADRADIRGAFWFGIAAHEFAHSLGADEKEASRVQMACQDQKYGEE